MARSQKDIGSKKWKERFIDAYKRIPIISIAARTANVSRNTVYEARRKDLTFAKQMDDANTEGAEQLESKAFEMAYGSNERMLMFLLEHVMPDKYGRKQRIDMQTNLKRFTIKLSDDEE
jgi:hypothetical protein